MLGLVGIESWRYGRFENSRRDGSQLKRGLFVIVPPELGRSAEYSGNPYLVARYLVDDAPHFLSHATAMELHRMVTQPQFVIFVSSTKRIPQQTPFLSEFTTHRYTSIFDFQEDPQVRSTFSART